MTGIEAPVINDSLSVEKAQRLVRGIATLPTIPAICLRVSTLLASPTVDLQKVADLILSDQVPMVLLLMLPAICIMQTGWVPVSEK